MIKIRPAASPRLRRPGTRWLNQFSFVLMLMGLMIVHGAQAAGSTPGLRAILGSQIPAEEQIRAVAMLDTVPRQADVDALNGLGLIAQPLKHLPMVLTKGTVAQLRNAVESGIARDVYIDRMLQWHSAESTAAMNAHLTRELGFDGSGVTIAVVDSGIDASHPDLENRVIRNVRVYSPEYLDILGINEPTGISWPAEPALVLPFDDLPYNNTDTIGHGTHVAGIAAGEGVGDGSLVGVAPGADVVGYSTGEILFIFTALASFDDILATHEEYNIKVINNSWGSRFHVFDPNSPINVATKALQDAGITIVFSAGNDGIEMTTNVHSMAPWVIMSGSSTISAEKSDFSSSGLMYDNSRPLELDEDGHVHYAGDGLGMSHPDVSAPGSNITSTCTPTGWTCAPTTPGGSGVSSGTSMSAPHMSGLAAVLLQANPSLTPDMVAKVMQVSSVPMRDGAAFWQSGYGFVDAKAAVDLVLRSDFNAELLDRLQAERDAAVLAARDYRVLSGDQWEFVSMGATVEGLESYDFSLDVGPETDAIRAGIAFPGDLGILGLNLLFEWSLTLIDPDGNEIASSELTDNIGMLHVDFDAEGLARKPGSWILRAEGITHISQPALLWGHSVTVAATQLDRQAASGPSGPVFEPTGELSLVMAGGSGQTVSPEGCDYDISGASGTLAAMADEACHAGTVGYLLNYGAGLPASFTSEPLARDTLVGGAATLITHLVTESHPIYSLAFASRLTYQIDAVDDDGNLLTPVGGGEVLADIGPTPTMGSYPLDIPVTPVPAGARLRLNMQFSGVYTSAMRLLWGGEYGDAGLTLQTGQLVPAGRSEDTPPSEERVAEAFKGGATGGPLMLIGLLLLGLRRRT